MKTLLLFCLFSALLETGSCLSCEVCFGVHSICTGDLHVCSEQMDSCGIIISETVIGELKTPNIIKACVSSRQCNLEPLFITLGNGISVSTNIACCEGKSCENPSVKVPLANTTLNSWRCPACYSVFSHHCKEEVIDCMGTQNQCLHISGTMKSGESTVHTTMKGCATESACAHIQQFQGAFGGLSADFTTAECRPAFSRLASMTPEPAALVLPALLPLLLGNVLS
ncbi:phospholipase A2 inhibitor gamma subunit B-like [Carettochelys insculpta]|uniref:phospholipase A2 inhibitor gamma subunit B-like n=1 Tax=Carettochelys insculpta TaxID=44489 RepID=UPI003EB9ECE2